MTKKGFDNLASKNPWPREKPKAKQNAHGWVNIEKQGYIRSQINHKPKYILELGAWLGQSTRFFLKTFPSAKVVTIDTWKGGVEHQGKNRKDSNFMKEILPRLYETFLVNCWDYKERLVPIRATTVEGIRQTKKAQFIPDLIFVDASHQYEDVLSDLSGCFDLNPKAVIIGDDWRWINSKTSRTSVQDAVRDFNKKSKLILTVVSNSSWSLKTLDYFKKLIEPEQGG